MMAVGSRQLTLLGNDYRGRGWPFAFSKHFTLGDLLTGGLNNGEAWRAGGEISMVARVAQIDSPILKQKATYFDEFR